MTRPSEASGGSRTHSRRITKAVLGRLSFAGIWFDNGTRGARTLTPLVKSQGCCRKHLDPTNCHAHERRGRRFRGSHLVETTLDARMARARRVFWLSLNGLDEIEGRVEQREAHRGFCRSWWASLRSTHPTSPHYWRRTSVLKFDLLTSRLMKWEFLSRKRADLFGLDQMHRIGNTVHGW
jgi:hypothetical protein